jgi:NAD(P)-dependent dehydrogenase (short-subunit alcohol dehydrogenase family)
MELEGKIAIVTGAGQGIGKAISLAFAREGADVIVDDINTKTGETTASEVRALGRRAIAFGADISNYNEVNQMVERVIGEWGGVDILVNNAGIGNTRLVEDLTEAEWHHVIGVNLNGTFYCSKAVIQTMKSRGGGKIVNIASPAARSMTRAACAAYTASKSAIVGFTRHLAFEVGPYKINVNTILSGALTPKNRATPEQVENMVANSLLGDIMRPEDMANIVLFLASDRSKMITAAAIVPSSLPGGINYWKEFVQKRKESFAKGEPAY